MLSRLVLVSFLLSCSPGTPSAVRKLPMVAVEMPLRAVHRGERALNLDVRVNASGQDGPSLGRDEFVERWVTRAVGIERQWVFPSEPQGEGPLEVRVDLHASNTRSVGANTEVTGASGTWGIGPATWVDARGRRSPVHSRLEDGHLLLVVEQSILVNSAYPAILDPVFTSLELLRPADVTPIYQGLVLTDGVDMYTSEGPYNPDGVSVELPLSLVGCFGPRACLARVDDGFVRVDPSTGVETGALANTSSRFAPLSEGGFVIASTSGPFNLQYYSADGTPGALVPVHPTEPISVYTSCSSEECIVRADEAVYNVTSAGATLLSIPATEVSSLLGIPGGGFWSFQQDRLPEGIVYEYQRTDGSLVPVGPAGMSVPGSALTSAGGQGLFLLEDDSNWTLVDAGGTPTTISRPAAVTGRTFVSCPDDCFFFSSTVRRVPVVFRYDRDTATLTEAQPFGTDTNSHTAAVFGTGPGDAAALWADRRRDDRGDWETSLRAGRVSRSGTWLGPELTLPEGEYLSALSNPLVLAHAPTAWMAMYGNRLWSFDDSGLLFARPANLGSSVFAAASHTDGAFLVLHRADRYSLRGVLVSGAATTADIDLGFGIMSSARSTSAAISSGDGAYLVVVTAFGVRGVDLFGVRVSEEGTVLDDVPISLSAADGNPASPKIVDDGNGWLVFWYESTAGLSVLRVAYDGTLPSPSTVVITAGGFDFACDYDGSDTWVAYRGSTGIDVLRMRGVTVMSSETIPAEGTDVGLAASDAHLLVSVITELSGNPLVHLASITNDVDGALCDTGDACESGFCVSGRCCDRACDGGCEACARTEGAESDGVCGPVAAGRVCRASTGSCDLEESCDGIAPMCPPESAPPPECVDAGASDAGMDAAPDVGASDDAGPGAADAAPSSDAGTTMDASVADSSTSDAGPAPDEGGCSMGRRAPSAPLWLVVFFAAVFSRRRS